MKSSLLSCSAALLLSLAGAPVLRAAEAYFLIDSGLVTAVDTETGAVLSSLQVSGPAAGGPTGMQFASYNSLYLLNSNSFAGDRTYRYVSNGSHSWTRAETTQLPDVTGRLQSGRRMALQASGMLLAIGQNSHDLWEAQGIGWSPNPLPNGTLLGKVRSFLPLQYPQEVAASPFGDSYAVWFSRRCRCRRIMAAATPSAAA